MGKHLILRQTPPCLSSAGKEFGAEDRNGKTALTLTQPSSQEAPGSCKGLAWPYLASDFPHTQGSKGPTRPGPSVTTAPAPALWGIPAKGPTACCPQSTVHVHGCTHSTQAHVPLTLH